MARDERASGAGSVSGMFAREGSGFDPVEGEEIHFGCSMLSRIRLRPRRGTSANLATMRCHLGYALRSDEDVARCMAVEGPGECWKVVPTWRVQPVLAPALEPVEPGVTVERDEAAEVVIIEQVAEGKVVPFRQPHRPTGTDASEAD